MILFSAKLIYKKGVGRLCMVFNKKESRGFEYLIKTYTNTGEIVLDNFIGFEIDKDYYDITCKRIKEHKEETNGN